MKVVYMASGQVARIVDTPGRDLSDEIPVHHPVRSASYGSVVGLPDPEPDTWYIVSLATALAAALATGRNDLLVPYDQIRDEDGRIIGCRELARPEVPSR